MSKRKTRAQKQKADARNLATVMSTPVYSFSSGKPFVSQTTKPTDDTLALVTRDLQKTALVSVSIIFLQIVFFLLLKNHVLAISFVRY